jgi:hypothetical protein
MALISPEGLNQYWEQFAVTGFPNGVSLGGIPTLGVNYSLTSAQLLALQTTAVQLVAAPTTTLLGNIIPPAGYAYYPKRLMAEYMYNTTAYTIANANNAFQIEYTGQTTALVSMLVTGLVDQTASTLAVNEPVTPGTKIALTAAANLGLEIKLTGTTPALTLGNGMVHIRLEYNIIPLF